MSDYNVCMSALNRYFDAMKAAKNCGKKEFNKGNKDAYCKAAKQVVLETAANYFKACYVQ